MTTDVIIIGTGQAGVPLATKLAAAGKRVLIVERGALGGTCVNTGCTPTKTMIASARAAHVARTAERLGIHVADVRVDFAAVVARKDAMVKRWRDGIENRIRSGGERLAFREGHARFVAERQIEVNGERHQADIVIINVGARPSVPAIPGLGSVPWLDNDSVMELRRLPEHLLILGGGYIGCELGQMFRRFGSRVTIVDHAEHLLDREDEDVSSELERVFRGEGIALSLGAGVTRTATVEHDVALGLDDGRELRGSHLLVAAGRRPNTDDLGCETAGVRLDPRGFVEVDERYQTSAAGVFAVGDVIDQPQFTHVAWDDHRILLDLLLGHSQRGRAGRRIPYAVFTDPQVAGVGLREREATANRVPYEVAKMPFGRVARAIEVDEPAGIIKVLIDPATEHILGAFVVGAEAGELIHVFVALMQANAPARAIVDAQAVHPTFAEGLQSALLKLPRFSSP
jgi:pyruvate/2-oxoglutarate dehydrogenase complex dihydrolipoamide dehydrogenase (E3) component